MRSRFTTVLGLAAMASLLLVGPAFAAVDPVTGIDPAATVADILASGKLWIAAGILVFVLLAAISLGRRVAGKFGVKG